MYSPLVEYAIALAADTSLVLSVPAPHANTYVLSVLEMSNDGPSATAVIFCARTVTISLVSSRIIYPLAYCAGACEDMVSDIECWLQSGLTKSRATMWFRTG